jgi:hypothetical protein
VWRLALAFVAACGRIGFDPHTGESTGSADGDSGQALDDALEITLEDGGMPSAVPLSCAEDPHYNDPCTTPGEQCTPPRGTDCCTCVVRDTCTKWVCATLSTPTSCPNMPPGGKNCSTLGERCSYCTANGAEPYLCAPSGFGGQGWATIVPSCP